MLPAHSFPSQSDNRQWRHAQNLYISSPFPIVLRFTSSPPSDHAAAVKPQICVGRLSWCPHLKLSSPTVYLLRDVD